MSQTRKLTSSFVCLGPLLCKTPRTPGVPLDLRFRGPLRRNLGPLAAVSACPIALPLWYTSPAPIRIISHTYNIVSSSACPIRFLLCRCLEEKTVTNDVIYTWFPGGFYVRSKTFSGSGAPAEALPHGVWGGGEGVGLTKPCQGLKSFGFPGARSHVDTVRAPRHPQMEYLTGIFARAILPVCCSSRARARDNNIKPQKQKQQKHQTCEKQLGFPRVIHSGENHQ